MDNLKTIVYLLTLLLQFMYSECICTTYKVSGTEQQVIAEGDYKFFGNCFDRPVYKSVSRDMYGRDQYLYYYDADYKYNGWLVSAYYCSYHQPILRVMDDANEPGLITNTWEERYTTSTNSYFLNTQINVNCNDSLPLGTIVGITLGVAFAVMILISVASLFIYKYRKREQNRPNNRGTSNMQGTETYPSTPSLYDTIPISPEDSYGMVLPPYSPHDPIQHNQTVGAPHSHRNSSINNQTIGIQNSQRNSINTSIGSEAAQNALAADSINGLTYSNANNNEISGRNSSLSNPTYGANDWHISERNSYFDSTNSMSNNAASNERNDWTKSQHNSYLKPLPPSYDEVLEQKKKEDSNKY